VAALLTYVAGFITGIVFLSIEPHRRDPNVKFHAWQSIFLNVAMIGVYIVLAILSSIMGLFLWSLMRLLWVVVELGMLAVWVLCMVKAYGGERWKLPFIGDLAEKQASKG